MEGLVSGLERALGLGSIGKCMRDLGIESHPVGATVRERYCSEAQCSDSLGCTTLTTRGPQRPARERLLQGAASFRSVLEGLLSGRPCRGIITPGRHMLLISSDSMVKKYSAASNQELTEPFSTTKTSLAGIGVCQDKSLTAGMRKSPRPTLRSGSSRGGVQRSGRFGSALGKSGCITRVFCGENLGKMEFGIQCRRQLTIWNGEGCLLTPGLCLTCARMWCWWKLMLQEGLTDPGEKGDVRGSGSRDGRKWYSALSLSPLQ